MSITAQSIKISYNAINISPHCSFTRKPNDVMSCTTLMGVVGVSVGEWKWYDLNFMGGTVGFLSLQARKQDQMETKLDHWLQKGMNECWACQTKPGASKWQVGVRRDDREHMRKGGKREVSPEQIISGKSDFSHQNKEYHGAKKRNPQTETQEAPLPLRHL